MQGEMKLIFCSLMILLWGSSSTHASQQEDRANDIVHLQKQDSATQLVVHNRPFLLLAGELGNSSASSFDHMRPIWTKIKKMHLNSVLIPAYWELIEPEEGRFEFTLIDSALASARQCDLEIVFLWLGSWKNRMSCYAPAWVG